MRFLLHVLIAFAAMATAASAAEQFNTVPSVTVIGRHDGQVFLAVHFMDRTSKRDTAVAEYLCRQICRHNLERSGHAETIEGRLDSLIVVMNAEHRSDGIVDAVQEMAYVRASDGDVFCAFVPRFCCVRIHGLATAALLQ
ncbi:MAG: hypothetical protein V1926_00640 [Candidatus Peregrinibacteria bacterium]